MMVFLRHCIDHDIKCLFNGPRYWLGCNFQNLVVIFRDFYVKLNQNNLCITIQITKPLHSYLLIELLQ